MFVLQTPRLTFRRLTADDVGDLAALYADAEVMRFFDGPRTHVDAEREIELCLRQYARYGYYLWAALLRSDGSFVGRCGLMPQSVNGREEVEVAYMLARSVWGHGLGTEAARAIRDYGFGRLTVPRLISLIAPGNLASVRVAEKNGMRYLGQVVVNGYTDMLYAVAREDVAAKT